MQHVSNRATVAIAGLLTLIILFVASLGVAFHNGWLQVASSAAVGNSAAQTAPKALEAAANTGPTRVQAEAQSVSQTAPLEEVTLYRQKLDDAYRALDEAYGQIRSLQAAQVQSEVRRGEDRDFRHDDDREDGAREHHRHDSDDD
jgi:hypothetical protein